MLGLRLIGDCQVDLWCGEPGEFYADVFEGIAGGCASSVKEILRAHEGKHLVIQLNEGDNELGAHSHADLRTVIEQLMAQLAGDSGAPRRVTFVFRQLHAYHQAQEVFFDLLPDGV